MAELHDRFRSFDRIAAPDLWAEVEERAAAAAPEPLSRLGVPPITGAWTDQGRVRTLRLVVLLALLVLTVLVLAFAFGRRQPVPTTPLVFMSLAGSEPALYTVDIDTGQIGTVMSWTGSRLHVSPNGRYALFDAVVGPSTGLEGPGPGLVLARTDGSDARVVDDPGYELGRVWESIWAPDSHAVAWLRWTADRTASVMVLEVDGGETRRIDIGPGVDPHLVWSPDNVHVAYVDWAECEGTTSPHLYVVDTMAADFIEVGINADLNSLPEWSHDGRRLAAHVANPTVATTPRSQETPDQASASCSPRVVPPAILIWDSATGEETRLPVGSDTVFNLAWARDDSALMALTATTLLTIPIDGGPAEELAKLEGGGALWSPDSTHLAWLEGGDADSASLWVMDVPGGERRRIAGDIGSGPEGWPLWSPDGQWLAFFRGPPTVEPGLPSGSIWIVRPDGSDERLLVDASVAPDLTGVDW